MPGEQPRKPVKPQDLEFPGLGYRPRKTGWHLIWSPRSDLVARGWDKATFRLWPPSGATAIPTTIHSSEPTRAEWEAISAWCEHHQGKMLAWANGGVPDDVQSVFDGTIRSLIRIYKDDPDSPYQNLRYKVRQNYANRLNAVETALGNVRVRDITFRDFRRWYDEFARPDVPGEPPMASRAYHLIKHLRHVFSFGKLVLPKSSGCADIMEILDQPEMEFPGGHRRRTEYLTAAQCRLIRIEAHRCSLHSIALAQAIMFECGLRQKDVIGEWLPHSEPGMSDIVTPRYKWLFGARWDEIDEHFVWKHRLSKSLKGKKAIMDAQAGKIEEFDLLAFPMVMEEFGVGNRAAFPASGPVILYEHSSRPWWNTEFSRTWRKLARAVGVPDAVQNRDSRAGAATEAHLAGVPKEHIQRYHGHSRAETTEIYLRGGRDIRSNIAQLRAEKRK